MRHCDEEQDQKDPNQSSTDPNCSSTVNEPQLTEIHPPKDQNIETTTANDLEVKRDLFSLIWISCFVLI